MLSIEKAQVAESYGLLVSPDEVRTGFRKAFKEMSAAHPLYGKFSNPPMHYEEWWTNLIEKTFQYTDVADSGEYEWPGTAVLDDHRAQAE